MNFMLQNTTPIETPFSTEFIEFDLNICNIAGQIMSEFTLVKSRSIFNELKNFFYLTLPGISSLVHHRELYFGENFIKGKGQSVKRLSDLGKGCFVLFYFIFILF